jgi:hypothetical protein
VNSFQTALNSPRFNRALLLLGAAVLVAGIVVVIIKLVPGTSGENTAPSPGFKAQVQKKQPVAKTAAGTPITRYSQVSPEAKLAMRKFILDAVAGHDYAASWPYVTKSIKQGYTFKQWVHANAHPFVPYPVYKFDKLSQFHLEWAHPKEMYFTVSVSAAPKDDLRPVVFWIGLTRHDAGDKWRVDYWMPRSGSPPVPSNN